MKIYILMLFPKIYPSNSAGLIVSRIYKIAAEHITLPDDLTVVDMISTFLIHIHVFDAIVIVIYQKKTRKSAKKPLVFRFFKSIKKYRFVNIESLTLPSKLAPKIMKLILSSSFLQTIYTRKLRFIFKTFCGKHFLFCCEPIKIHENLYNSHIAKQTSNYFSIQTSLISKHK